MTLFCGSCASSVLYRLYSALEVAECLLFRRVEVGGEMGETRLGSKLSQEGKQVLLDIQRVDWVSFAVRVLLLHIVQVVLGRGQQLAEVNRLIAGV